MRAWTLPLAAAAFWSGIALQGLLHGGSTLARSVALLTCGAALLGVAFLPRARALLGWGAWLVLALSFALVGSGWASLHELHVRTSPLATLTERPVTIFGSVETAPAEGAFGWTATVRAELLIVRTHGSPQEAIRVSDRVWAEGHGAPPPLAPGDRVTIEGVLSPLRGSFGEYFRHRGYPAMLSVDRLAGRGPPRQLLRRVANRLRAAFGRSLQRVFPPREAGLVMGLALGDTSKLDPVVEETFRATGLSHLTAVSGENLAMFMAPILGVAVLLRVGRIARMVIGAVAVVFFVLLTGGEPSVMRAAAMASLTLLGVFLGRPRSPPAILAGAILLLLARDPTLIYSIGFQLSVGATTGIALMAGPVAERLRMMPKGLALAAGTTVAAQAGVTPLLLYHFGVVPLVSIPANVLAFPAVGPAMILGLLAAAAGAVSTSLGVAVGLLGRVPLGYLEALAQRLARSPIPSVTSSGSHLHELLAGLLLVAALGWWVRSGAGIPRRALAAALVALPFVLWAGALRAGAPSSPVITFFDVGQGDAALVRSAGGGAVLIDGGPDPELVARKLAALGIRRLDLVVATHPHADHVAGLPAVLARFPVSLVLDPGCRDASPAYAAFLSAVTSAGVPFRHPRSGSSFIVGDISILVLGPERCFDGTSSDPNNDSLVLRVVLGGAVVLFPGDAEEPNQADLLRDELGWLPAVVLKVPHHGGATSLPAFFQAVHAAIAIVSVGPNRYGHPVASVLRELEADHMRVFRTDRSGDVTVTVRRGEVLVSAGS